MAVQLVVSTLCKYRLTLSEHITRQCFKKTVTTKPRNSPEFGCLHVSDGFFFLLNIIAMKTSTLTVIQFNMQLMPVTGSQHSSDCLFYECQRSFFRTRCASFGSTAVQGHSPGFRSILSLVGIVTRGYGDGGVFRELQDPPWLLPEVPWY